MNNVDANVDVNVGGDQCPETGTRVLMKVTIRDVAKRAGVSTRTVSRVVNQQGEISEETRARVQAVIEELGYRPNILARSLVSQRSNMLGVVTWGLDYYAPSRIVVGIEQRSSKLGYSLFLHLISHPTDAGAENILNTLADHRVDGIIWAIPEVGENHDWAQRVSLDNLPPIVFLNTESRTGLDSIAVDNRRGGELATQHLIDQGCRKIGLISGPQGWWEAQERCTGWQDALVRAGLDPSPRRIVQADWSVEIGMQAMQRLLAQAPEIDGVFASSDDIALGALTAAVQSGRRIPEDLALVGFDNIPQSAHFQPPLTTIDQPLTRTGRAAVDLLLERIECRRSEKDQAGAIAAGTIAAGAIAPANALRLEPGLVIRASSIRSGDQVPIRRSLQPSSPEAKDTPETGV
jgi:LacI family transcriptional regulator